VSWLLADLLMDDRRGKAFDFAQEATKQVVTLATAIIALTVTFVNDIAGEGAVIELLYVAWGFYLVSVACGLATLLMLAGNLERPHQGDTPSIYAPNTKGAARVQIATFVVALGLTLIFGATAA
jgi:hypothetical protein